MITAVFNVETTKLSIFSDFQQLSSMKKCILHNFKSEEEVKRWYCYAERRSLKKYEREKTVFCDAGTAFKKMECRVTDEKGFSLLEAANERGNYEVNLSINNAELFSFKLAIECAIKTDVKNVAGDSMVVVFYWLNEFFLGDKFSAEPLLYKEAIKSYKEFREIGGDIEYIDRSINPADLRYGN